MPLSRSPAGLALGTLLTLSAAQAGDPEPLVSPAPGYAPLPPAQQADPESTPSGHITSPRQRLCDAGDGSACRELADAFSSSGDYFTAMSYLERACGFYESQSCADAAAGYLTGNFYGTDCQDLDPCLLIELDPSKGFAFAQKACSEMNPMGCYLKGYAYEHGLGTAVSHLTAIAVWRQNCKKRYDGHSCVELGIDPPIPKPPKLK